MRIRVCAENCTVDGYGWFGEMWDELDFENAEFRTKASIMEFLYGDKAPVDLHLNTPKPSEETWHRVRMRKERRGRAVLVRFEKGLEDWWAVYEVPK